MKKAEVRQKDATCDKKEARYHAQVNTARSLMRESRRRLSVVLAASLAIAGCTNVGGDGGWRSRRSTEVRIAAAADLQGTLDEAVERFRSLEASGKARIVVSYGSSGALYTQIVNGADFDLYLAAHASYVARLVEAGVASADAAFFYARGRVAVVGKPGFARVASEGITALVDPEVGKVAIANPEHAPYGKAAVEALDAYGVHQRIKDKLVLGENVAQAMHFVKSGAADAGIVALSLVIAGDEELPLWVVPGWAHAPLLQGGVLLEGKGDPAIASRFVQFLTSPEGKEILERYGFETNDLPSSAPVGELRRQSGLASVEVSHPSNDTRGVWIQRSSPT